MKSPRQSKPMPPTADPLRLRLYVAGELPNSLDAIASLQSLDAKSVTSPVTIEIVDMLREPERALQDGIVATPTLVRLSPPPVVRIFGNLSNLARVRSALGLGPQQP